MDNMPDTLEQLKNALEKLSPRDRVEWTEWIETRLTERLRIRQELARATSPETGAADNHEDE
jgi:hypothetical protein